MLPKKQGLAFTLPRSAFDRRRRRRQRLGDGQRLPVEIEVHIIICGNMRPGIECLVLSRQRVEMGVRMQREVRIPGDRRVREPRVRGCHGRGGRRRRGQVDLDVFFVDVRVLLFILFEGPICRCGDLRSESLATRSSALSRGRLGVGRTSSAWRRSTGSHRLHFVLRELAALWCWSGCSHGSEV